MTERKIEIWDAITAVLNSTETKEQFSLFNKWLEESDGNRKTFDVLTKVRGVKNQPSQIDKEDVYERIHTEIRKGRNERQIKLMRYGNIASVFIIISLCVVLLWPKAESHSGTVIIRCPYGTKSKLTLSDGTIVHLNSGSVLEYPPIFAASLREVKLNGEAFFEVTHENNREFIVKTGEIGIKVFGTRFNIKNYETDKAIETSLVEGSIGVIRNNDLSGKNIMRLKPNEQAIYNKKTGKLYTRAIDAELVSIWKEGKYFFENESFENIAQKLEREFNTSIIIKSEDLCNEIFTGMFDKNKTIKQMLDLMKRKRNFSYKVLNDTIIITKM